MAKFVTERFQDFEGKWRVRIKAQRVEFTDEKKEIFLAHYRVNGRNMEAAKAAGVTTQTVNRHISKDPDFAEACLEAEDEYRNKLVAHHQNLVFEGTTKNTYDRQGNLVSSEQVYPIPLIQMELRKHDPGYRDKAELDVKHTGGVLVAPAEVASIESWEEKYGGKTVDLEAEDVTEKGTTDYVGETD